jgi:hypothetical protein
MTTAPSSPKPSTPAQPTTLSPLRKNGKRTTETQNPRAPSPERSKVKDLPPVRSKNQEMKDDKKNTDLKYVTVQFPKPM